DVELGTLAASLRMDPARLAFRLEQLELAARGLPLGVDPHGQLAGYLTLPTAGGQRPAGAVRFSGKILASASELSAELARDELRADLRVRAEPASLSRLGLRASRPIALEAHAQGPLSACQLVASVAAERSRLELTAEARLESPLSARVALHGTGLDL